MIRYDKMGKLKLKDYIFIIGSGGVLASHVVLFHTFLVAYFNPTKSVVVHINHYKEAHIELVFLTIVSICVIIMIYQFYCSSGTEVQNGR